MNFIDLFAGAGGLSEGFLRSGFLPIAHVEMKEDACETLRTRSFFYYLRKKSGGMDFYRSYLLREIPRREFVARMPKLVYESVINETMSDETLPSIFNRIDKSMKAHHQKSVDVIIGGPPCQAYSVIGRARTDMSNDPRNKLYLLYLQFLERYRPRVFVFENVQGIVNAGGGVYFKDLQEKCTGLGYQISPRILKAEDYGVLQHRRREIIIGIRSDKSLSNEEYPYPTSNPQNFISYLVGDLFADLPSPSLSFESSPKDYKDVRIPDYLLQTGIRTKEDVLSLHYTRPVRPFDQDIYRFVIDRTLQTGKAPRYDEFPSSFQSHQNKTSFLDRFKMVPAHSHTAQTVVAHLAKDGHYYIYPDREQARSISVREAARLQSFPDNFFFEGSRTSAFTQIGNAVPPLLAYAIAREIKNYLNRQKKSD